MVRLLHSRSSMSHMKDADVSAVHAVRTKNMARLTRSNAHGRTVSPRVSTHRSPGRRRSSVSSRMVRRASRKMVQVAPADVRRCTHATAIIVRFWLGVTLSVRRAMPIGSGRKGMRRPVPKPGPTTARVMTMGRTVRSAPAVRNGHTTACSCASPAVRAAWRRARSTSTGVVGADSPGKDTDDRGADMGRSGCSPAGGAMHPESRPPMRKLRS
mmetsp:Transcript_21266/g.66639  ORF Transcript_21266/g.66639 Transcript_21266/m.66639 type:complete len:213 (-) Transcript_21266:65-703(-)